MNRRHILQLALKWRGHFLLLLPKSLYNSSNKRNVIRSGKNVFLLFVSQMFVNTLLKLIIANNFLYLLLILLDLKDITTIYTILEL